MEDIKLRMIAADTFVGLVSNTVRPISVHSEQTLSLKPVVLEEGALSFCD
jgi:hypothetical protein